MKRFNQETERQFKKAKDLFLVVEGEKDKNSLIELGFKNIFVLNETGKSLYEKIEQIEEKAGKRKICILTDFDKRGKRLYLLLKSELSTRKLRLDNSFRGILLKLNISHIEGLSSFIENERENGKSKQKHRKSYENTWKTLRV